ncbi:MAG: hypothetical protein INR71_11435 [Terriglobus roseus]|nr:hypothetical protein [Terriglobus roseus]
MKVANVPFPDVGYSSAFFWRPNDGRARFIISRTDSQGRSMYCCCPHTALKLYRTSPTLSLNRIDTAQRIYTLWARLHFRTYEQQVLFYCTFVALKRQDSELSPRGLDDFFGGEELRFSGSVNDGAKMHRLHMRRDIDCGAVRLEASPLRGSMVRTPIWTAFITEYVRTSDWLRRRTRTVVELDELRPYVFCNNYTPPRGPNGRFQLDFTTAEDAEGFVTAFRRL